MTSTELSNKHYKQIQKLLSRKEIHAPLGSIQALVYLNEFIVNNDDRINFCDPSGGFIPERLRNSVLRSIADPEKQINLTEQMLKLIRNLRSKHNKLRTAAILLLGMGRRQLSNFTSSIVTESIEIFDKESEVEMKSGLLWLISTYCELNEPINMNEATFTDFFTRNFRDERSQTLRGLLIVASDSFLCSNKQLVDMVQILVSQGYNQTILNFIIDKFARKS